MADASGDAATTQPLFADKDAEKTNSAPKAVGRPAAGIPAGCEKGQVRAGPNGEMIDVWIEQRVRAGGATKGHVDKYYYLEAFPRNSLRSLKEIQRLLAADWAIYQAWCGRTGNTTSSTASATTPADVARVKKIARTTAKPVAPSQRRDDEPAPARSIAARSGEEASAAPKASRAKAKTTAKNLSASPASAAASVLTRPESGDGEDLDSNPLFRNLYKSVYDRIMDVTDYRPVTPTAQRVARSMWAQFGPEQRARYHPDRPTSDYPEIHLTIPIKKRKADDAGQGIEAAQSPAKRADNDESNADASSAAEPQGVTTGEKKPTAPRKKARTTAVPMWCKRAGCTRPALDLGAKGALYCSEDCANIQEAGPSST